MTPYVDSPPADTWFGDRPRSPFELALVAAVKRGNLPLAELLVRRRLTHLRNTEPEESARLLRFLGWVAHEAGLHEQSITLLPRSGTLPNRFLLIKAWGFGFWADVSHVLCQLLVAELTGRIPIVHWGPNSLFWDGTASNAFDPYFEPVSPFKVDALRDERLRIWPPKWNWGNLLTGEINKWAGPYSRLAGIYLLGRSEEIVVSDFYTPIQDLKPWIPKESRLYGVTLDDLHEYLLQAYLHPRQEIIARVDAFYREQLAGSDFIGVHARGSDKRVELATLDDVNRQSQRAVDDLMVQHQIDRVFLMTDDTRLRDHYLGVYGERVVCTDCQRTDTAQGVHHQSGRDRRQLGIEVAVDVYLATRGKAFVGNGSSNPSQMVRYLKHWPAGHAKLLGTDLYHWPDFGPSLHNW